jgi:protoporphyrinogen oxidase
MSRCIIIGAGSVGILSAYLCAQKYDEVFLIDKDNNLGGLLSSFEINGAIYDYGTHIPSRTGNGMIDEFFYGGDDNIEKNYYKFPCLKSENYFKGEWNKTNTLLDVRKLNEIDYLRGLVELLEAPGLDGTEISLSDFLCKTVGKTYTEKAYKTVVEKLQGTDIGLEELVPEVLRIFGLQRVMALTNDVTKELKTKPRLDASLGFHHYDDGDRDDYYFYPKGNHGIGKWMDSAVAKLKKNGVKIITGESVSSISHVDGNIASITLSSGEELSLDHLVWTVPAFLAFKAANITFSAKPPEFRNHILCHYEFDKPLLKTEPQYLLCWASEYYSYRITLYPNITPDKGKSSRNNLTVEVLSGKLEDGIVNDLLDIVHEELIKLQVIDKDAIILASKIQDLGAGFPVFSIDFMKNVKKQSSLLSDSLTNFNLLGRASGRGFFINDLLLDAYKQLIENKNG